MYSYVMENEEEEKKCKGIKKSVVRNGITYQDYVDWLFGGGMLSGPGDFEVLMWHKAE